MENEKQTPCDKRCGSCLFAQGGDEFKFRNGETNVRYTCTLMNRKGSIVLLNGDSFHYRWHNQRACEDYEPSSDKTLKKRPDLDKRYYYFLSDGHFEIINNPTP